MDHVLTQHTGLDKIENRSLMKLYIGKIIVNTTVTIFCIDWEFTEAGTVFILSE